MAIEPQIVPMVHMFVLGVCLMDRHDGPPCCASEETVYKEMFLGGL
jgi:hypothetical protein